MGDWASITKVDWTGKSCPHLILGSRVSCPPGDGDVHWGWLQSRFQFQLTLGCFPALISRSDKSMCLFLFKVEKIELARPDTEGLTWEGESQHKTSVIKMRSVMNKYDFQTLLSTCKSLRGLWTWSLEAAYYFSLIASSTRHYQCDSG